MKTQFLLLLCAAAHLRAQDPVPCNTWFVDPANGVDTNAGSLLAPFRTLTHAMMIGGTSPGPDSIVLLPGLYVESWPILMQPDVSIQGTSALNTVLRSSGGASSVLKFLPTSPTAFDNVVVDGVTLIGALRCVEIVDADVAGLRVRANPTLANCFLIDSAITAVDIVVSPTLTPFPGHDTDFNGLVEHRPKFINCTVVDSRIGILNRIDLVPMSFGESEPGLLNCLLSNNSITDLEGIDAADVVTCAFATSDGFGISPVKAGRVQPASVFNTIAFPPKYVDDGHLGMALTPFDLRIKPDSPAIDVGSMPALAWANGTTGQRLFACTIDIFDVDCEGYGNSRVARTAIDIGADESGELILAGYQRGTTQFGPGPDSPFPGQMAFWLNPFPAFPPGAYAGNAFLNWIPFIQGLGFWQAWSPTTIQDVRGILTLAPTPIPGLGTLLMDVSNVIPLNLVFVAPPTPLMLPLPIGGSLVQMNTQAVPSQGTTTSTLTNLQTFFFGQ